MKVVLEQFQFLGGRRGGGACGRRRSRSPVFDQTGDRFAGTPLAARLGRRNPRRRKT
jgi:hypothetical protein